MAESKVVVKAMALGELIRAYRNEIVDEWADKVRRLPIARDLERLALIDHIPELLDEIAGIVDTSSSTAQAPPKRVAELHALERLHEGFDLAQVVIEFSVLRDCVLQRWQSSAPCAVAEVRVLNQAIDHAVGASVARFTKVRDRTLFALDRIATEALESRNLSDLLQRLLQVFVDTTPAVDIASIPMSRGTRLEVRASIGLGDLPDLFDEEFGTGFAGLVAADQLPRAVNAQDDATVTTPSLRRSGVRALFGVPLANGGVLGVMAVGQIVGIARLARDQRLVRVVSISPKLRLVALGQLSGGRYLHYSRFSRSRAGSSYRRRAESRGRGCSTAASCSSSPTWSSLSRCRTSRRRAARSW